MRKARDSIPAKAGVGLRFRHHHEVLESRPTVAWFEVHSENYMGGGSAPAYLDAIRRDYAVSLHGTPRASAKTRGADRARARVRASVVERRRRRLSRRPASPADDRGSARERVPAPRTGPG